MLTGDTTVYLCTWKRHKGKIVVSLAGEPEVSASGKDVEVASDKLSAKLNQRPGAGEAWLEFLRPLPKDALAKRFGDPDLVLVTGHAKPGALENADQVYAHPPCEKCKRQRRQRTDAAARFASLPPADSCAGPGFGHLYSDRFLKQLTGEERALFTTRQVEGPGADNRAFFELHGEPMAAFVGQPGFPGRIGGACPECGLVSFTYIMDWNVVNFVARADLAMPLPGVFPVRDDLGDTRLAMTRERYTALRAGEGMECVISLPLFVAPGEVDRGED